ncbi:MAG: asparagine synthase (glutamine-hydrolyzing), partial [Bacteroidota bacterium]
MCGIAGGIALKASGSLDRTTIQQMGECIRHRGPDEVGWLTEGPIGLVHRRLSIIDVASGKQPMTSADGKVSLIFNGEIYNYLELRQELEGVGCQFQTQSDTEVVLQAYQKWGTTFQQRLNGMWALAIWDREHQQLLLSRDRLGQKPLFVFQDRHQLLFSSEIRAFRIGRVSLEPNLDLLELYLFLGYLPAPYTFWKGVISLKPGEYWLIRRGRISQHRHWELPTLVEGDMSQDQQGVQEAFQAHFEDSIRLRMRADVPYGMFLSGGLDSSAILAKMTNISSQH